jgi:hypothetical protein
LPDIVILISGEIVGNPQFQQARSSFSRCNEGISMPINNQLVQIWINLPGKDYQETLQAKPLEKPLFQVREIPFISNQVNFMDIVYCNESTDCSRLFTGVFKPSGYSTLHLIFAQSELKETVGDCIRMFLQTGATYRRSGLRAFSINIPPETDRSNINEFVKQLREKGILSDEDRDGIGAAEQSVRHLDYLLGRHPKLQDGHLPETELVLMNTNLTKPA